MTRKGSCCRYDYLQRQSLHYSVKADSVSAILCHTYTNIHTPAMCIYIYIYRLYTHTHSTVGYRVRLGAVNIYIYSIYMYNVHSQSKVFSTINTIQMHAYSLLISNQAMLYCLPPQYCTVIVSRKQR